MAIDCTKPNLSQQEQSLCSCKLATDTIVKAYDNYQLELLDFVSKDASYIRWNQKYTRWQNKTGEYEKYKKYDGVNREFWANSHDGTCWWGENWNAAHDWCHWAANQKGYDGENYWAKSWGWCSGRHGNFLCKKQDETVNNQNNAYKADMPITDPDSDKQWFNFSPPVKPELNISNNNILCCSQIFSDINVSGGPTEISNINQNCQQRIINELNNPAPTPSTSTPSTSTPSTSTPSTSTPSTSTPSTSTPSTSTPSTSIPSTSTPSTSTNQQMIIIVIVIILLMSCSSIGGLFLINTS
jgi:hypothetical protein